MASVLEVWVTEAGMACRVDDDKWRVDVFDAHTQTYKWGGNDYTNMPAPHGHWAGAIPPGIYVVRARRQKPGLATDFAVVDVGCEGVTCVRLYVRPPRDQQPEPEPERPEEEDDRPRPQDPHEPPGHEDPPGTPPGTPPSTEPKP